MAKQTPSDVARKLEERALVHRPRAFLAENRPIANLLHSMRRAAVYRSAAHPLLSRDQFEQLQSAMMATQAMVNVAIRNGARKAAGLPVEAPTDSGPKLPFDQERPL